MAKAAVQADADQVLASTLTCLANNPSFPIRACDGQVVGSASQSCWEDKMTWHMEAT